MSLETKKNKIRYFYRTEGNRRIVGAYRYDWESGDLTYGATIFQQKSNRDVFIKKDHRDTAKSRLERWPITLMGIGTGLTTQQVEDIIRNTMFEKGVRGNRRKNQPSTGFPVIAIEYGEKDIKMPSRSLFDRFIQNHFEVTTT